MGYLQQQIIHIQAFGSVALLVGFLVAATLLQTRASAQSKKYLETLSPAVRETDLFKSAAGYVERRNVSLINVFTGPGHAVPVWFLILVVLAGSLLTYFGAEFIADGNTKSYVLGGAYATRVGPIDPGLKQYQSGTVFVVSMAFLGAYIWTIASLLRRINNYDMRPNTYYFLSIRILTACLVAVIARHMADALPALSGLLPGNRAASTNAALGGSVVNAGAPWVLAALGFVIGLKPNLFLSELWQASADKLLGKLPRQRPPTPASLPQELPLSMLQGLVDDKIERLIELDIDSCQKLATENAIVVWLRTTYNLDIILDWVAQAQLCVLFDGDKVEPLRKLGIRDIFAYFAAITDRDAREAVKDEIAIPLAIINSHVTVIGENPAFQRLNQLRKAVQIDRPVQAGLALAA